MSEVKVNKISPRTNCGTVTLGDSGDTFSIPAGVTLTNSGTATGFGPTGAVSWDTTKITADPNPAVSGVGYFADTTSAAFTVTLPAAPSAGDIVALSDYTGTWTTNNITVGRNSSNINGAAADLLLNGNNTTATLIYVDATEGWRVIDTGSLSEVNIELYVAATGGTITTCGNYKIHTFTGPGTFTVSSAGNSLGSNSVDYLVVAGGGSGGTLHGGGGGAGGFRESVPSPAAWTASPLASTTSLPVSVQGYPITVGAGGTAPRSSGSNSVFSTITSAAGGGGAIGCADANKDGLAGGSGGGSATGLSALTIGSVGTGNTPPVAPPQGNNGGNGSSNASTYRSGGGGGGATVSGTGNTPPTAPEAANPGGNGATTSISGSPTAYAGGGGGASSNSPGAGSGGSGGGGNGGHNNNPSPARNATTNTGGGGGGGGGGGSDVAGNGGSGIVIIRYKFQ